jgi:hypothetical protein
MQEMYKAMVVKLPLGSETDHWEKVVGSTWSKNKDDTVKAILAIWSR